MKEAMDKAIRILLKIQSFSSLLLQKLMHLKQVSENA